MEKQRVEVWFTSTQEVHLEPRRLFRDYQDPEHDTRDYDRPYFSRCLFYGSENVLDYGTCASPPHLGSRFKFRMQGRWRTWWGSPGASVDDMREDGGVWETKAWTGYVALVVCA